MPGAPRWAGAWVAGGPGWARVLAPGSRASTRTQVVRNQGLHRRGLLTGALLPPHPPAHTSNVVACGRLCTDGSASKNCTYQEASWMARRILRSIVIAGQPLALPVIPHAANH